MMDKIFIRMLMPEDWRLVKSLRTQAIQEYACYFWDSPARVVTHDDEYWKGMLGRENSVLFGVFDGEDMVGITALSAYHDSPEDTVVLGFDYIMPTHRGRGLGHMFYNARMEWIKHRPSIRRALVNHRKGNSASEALIKKHGFQKYEEAPFTYGDGTEGISMRYELWMDRIDKVQAHDEHI